MSPVKSNPWTAKIWAAAVLALYIVAMGVLPVYATQVIFKNELWLAKFIVYMTVVIAVAYGIRTYKADLFLYRWIKSRYGVKIF